MGILDEDIARVRDQTDLAALVGEYTAVKRVGRRYMALCPFHQEKTASFSINPELGLWKCLAGETRVITWEGVRPISELAGGTHRILTERGRWTEAPFFSFGRQRLMRVRIGRNRVEKDLFATAEHRWFVRVTTSGVRKERTTEELKPGDRLSWSFPQGGAKVVRPSPFGIARGITFGDGHRLGKGSAVDLIGSKDAQLLKWFPNSHTYQRHYDISGHSGDSLKVVDLPAYFKELPPLDEAPSYLLGWLAGYFAADGCVAADGTVILNSACRDNLEFVRLLCTRLGLGTYGITSQVRLGMGRTPSELFRIHLITEDLDEDFFLLDEHRLRFQRSHKAWTRRGWVVRSVEPTDRDEEVFCAVVPDTHSFVLEDNILTGNCFGCDKGGDPISFLREIEHIDFVDAVERLAQRANIQLRYDDRAVNRDRSRRARLVEAVGAAVDFYHRTLLEAPDAGVARKYLRGRGFDGDAARRFVLGWAPDDWDTLSRHLQRAKFSRDDLTESGLAFVNRVNKLQDQFRARLLFPIYDAKGEPVGFGGRTLADDGPKYKNSPETPIYQKSRLLYGLNWARAEIVAKDEVVICEGYTDVMAYALTGCANAVATCGTALADDHVKMLKNLARRVVLAYDSDAAGQGAAERWYRWEQELELEVRVADLPAGKDPGDLWLDDRERLPASVERAEPFLQFRVDRELAAADLSTIEGRARAAAAASAMVAEHPSELVRDQYAVQLAERLELAVDGVRAQISRPVSGDARGRARPVRNAPPEADAPVSATTPTGAERRELDVLRWAIHEPTLVEGWLDSALLVDPTARAVYQLLVDHSDLHDAIDAADGATRRVLERLAVEEPDAGDEPETLGARLIVHTVEPVAKRMLMRMLRDDDERATTVKAELDVLAHAREVGDWTRAQAAAEQLVGWIVHEAQPAPEPPSSEWVEQRVEQQA